MFTTILIIIILNILLLFFYRTKPNFLKENNITTREELEDYKQKQRNK